jgi:23S rRNA (uracil1939-C5)-methyltransferase
MRGGDSEPLELAPGGFGQASEAMSALLAQRVDAAAAEVAPARIVELHAGAGTLSVMLARRAPLVTYETDAAACEAARANLARRGLQAKVVHGDAATYLRAPRPDLLVLDPPRTGARGVAERLANEPVPHVAYVACDTRTLARDLAILAAARYVPVRAEAFAMFPHTSHVEALVLLAHAGRA